MKTSKIKFIIIASFFIFCNGCGFNPFAPSLTDDDGGLSQILTEQQTPQEVMANFSYAYNFKDSLVYADLLDSTFLFISKDYSTNPVTDLTWGRDTDIRTTTALFRHFQTLNLIWGGTIREAYISDDSTQVELKQVFQLTIDGGNEIPTLNGEALFILKKNQSGLWKITRWEDLAAF